MVWYIYILKCNDGSYYTGIASNLERRIDEHNKSNTISSKYTRVRRPVVLVYQETATSRSSALKREAAMKKLPRAEKEKLIAGDHAAT